VNDLESLVTSRELSQQLVDAGIVIPTALVWCGSDMWGQETWYIQVRQSFEAMRAKPEADRMENGARIDNRGVVVVPAPTMSELKAFLMPDDRTTTEWWADVVLKVKSKRKP
jgi:hypothetical protein